MAADSSSTDNPVAVAVCAIAVAMGAALLALIAIVVGCVLITTLSPSLHPPHVVVTFVIGVAVAGAVVGAWPSPTPPGPG